MWPDCTGKQNDRVGNVENVPREQRIKDQQIRDEADYEAIGHKYVSSTRTTSMRRSLRRKADLAEVSI